MMREMICSILITLVVMMILFPTESISSTSDTEILGEDNDMQQELSDMANEERVCSCKNFNRTKGNKIGPPTKEFHELSKSRKRSR